MRQTKSEKQIRAMLDQQADLSSKESGCALNAETYWNEARKSLAKGDYSGFLCQMDLAGQFARDAREAYYARIFK